MLRDVELFFKESQADMGIYMKYGILSLNFNQASFK